MIKLHNFRQLLLHRGVVPVGQKRTISPGPGERSKIISGFVMLLNESVINISKEHKPAKDKCLKLISREGQKIFRNLTNDQPRAAIIEKKNSFR